MTSYIIKQRDYMDAVGDAHCDYCKSYTSRNGRVTYIMSDGPVPDCVIIDDVEYTLVTNDVLHIAVLAAMDKLDHHHDAETLMAALAAHSEAQTCFNCPCNYKCPAMDAEVVCDPQTYGYDAVEALVAQDEIEVMDTLESDCSWEDILP